MNHLLHTYVLVLIVQLSILPQVAVAQTKGFIYGKVTTRDGESYQGPLRWGKEEVYWTDFFNASKPENEYLDYLSREDYQELKRNKDIGNRMAIWVSNRWGDWDDTFTHQFVCQFGELKSIKIYRRNDVKVELRDGTTMDLNGRGYNDIGSKIRILDEELGEIKLEWDRIQLIEFLKTPNSLDQTFGDPLYGTVETDYGSFTGFIQWDHDERVSEDKLDGDTYDGDLSIAFGKIKSIESMGNRCEVILKSGRNLMLRGSNDVNGDNDGIIVTLPKIGRVDIPWREFVKVTFSSPPNQIKGFDDFQKRSPLRGIVKTRDQTIEGEIIYDLDESSTIEILHGEQNRIEYLLPFRNIKSIEPKTYRYSEVVLKNGDRLRLEESQDVSDKNNGILVLEDGDPSYLPWYKIESIVFK